MVEVYYVQKEIIYYRYDLLVQRRNSEIQFVVFDKFCHIGILLLHVIAFSYMIFFIFPHPLLEQISFNMIL